ncbi:MAG TPA: CHASE domain-containing protein [Verrucomicrobiae bacterium]|nr:CHASE domain-containing protein [Verrucomicrobiae bacterium]
MSLAAQAGVPGWARTLGGIAIVTVAYWISGRLGLLLAIPPGYATAVWPASGIALAAILLAGPRVAMGIVVGSVLLNAPTALSASGMGMALPLALTIGVGAAAQALLGAWLITRFVGTPRLLQQETAVVRMLMLGGPVACALNPCVGVGSLWLAGKVTADSAWLNLWTWWVGDSIGVMVFTPLVLVWAARPYRTWILRQLFVTVPLVALFAAVVALFFFISQREQARIAFEFDEHATKLGKELAEDLQATLHALNSIEALFASSETVEQHEFEIFAGRLLTVLPAVRGLSWNEVVTAENRAQFERSMQAVNPGYRIVEGERGAMRPATARAQYSPIRFVVPRNGNAAVVGYDTLSEPRRRAALERARDTGQVTATGGVALLQDPVDGLLAFLPVYRNGIQPQTLTARRRYLYGYATAIFRTDMVMAGIERVAQREGFAVRLFDDEPLHPELLYALDAQGQGAAGGLTREIRFRFADRPLRLALELPAQALVAHRSWATWLVLAGGLLLTGLFGLLLLLGVGRAARVTAVVEQRTAELRSLNANLVGEVGRRQHLESEAGRRADELARSNAELQRQAEVNRQLLRSLRHSEGELRRTATQLAASNRELEQFAYVASHDLKAPLRSIGSFAQLLERRHGAGLAGESREFLTFIQDGIKHMQMLIDDLMQLSRVDARKLEPAPVSMKVVLERACRQLTADIHAVHAQVHASPLPDVHADANMLVQLLQNLIGNAIKFQSPGARPEIWVDAHPDGEGWHFTVRDNGIGIEPAHLEHIFLVFKRLHTSDQFPGNGIGLAVCKKVVALHGGEIWAESSPREGTTIHFTLPRGGEPVAAAA